MSDIELVIKIPEEIMEYIKNNGCLSVIYDDNVAKAIINGTPLPNGHGRLTDLDEIIRFTYATYGIGSGRSITEDNKDFIDYIYNDAPVLLEADNAESDE